MYLGGTAVIAVIDLIPMEISQKIGIVRLTKITIWFFFTSLFIGLSWLLSYRKQIKKRDNESRFNTAISQLQDSSHTTRLAGIDSLKRIALDSPNDYFYTVIDILTAFVKEKSPLSRTGDIADNQDDDVSNDVKDLPLDIQAAVKAVGHFRKPRKKDERHPIDLSGTNLKNITLSNADLRWINFEWTILRGAKLNRAKLKGANLESVDIRWADLTATDLHKANLLDTKYNENTVFPKGFNPKTHNMLFLNMDDDC